jgi:hypothetical protein
MERRVLIAVHGDGRLRLKYEDRLDLSETFYCFHSDLSCAEVRVYQLQVIARLTDFGVETGLGFEVNNFNLLGEDCAKISFRVNFLAGLHQISSILKENLSFA